MTKKFRSRVSVLLLVFLTISVLPIFLLEEPIKDQNEALVAYGTLAAAMVFVVLILFTLRYEIDEKNLTIKIGPLKYGKLLLSDIQKVERSYIPLSAPASSLKRLLITAKGKDALISPTNEEEFIRQLKISNPEILIDISDKSDWWRFWNWDL